MVKGSSRRDDGKYSTRESSTAGLCHGNWRSNADQSLPICRRQDWDASKLAPRSQARSETSLVTLTMQTMSTPQHPHRRRDSGKLRLSLYRKPFDEKFQLRSSTLCASVVYPQTMEREPNTGNANSGSVQSCSSWNALIDKADEDPFIGPSAKSSSSSTEWNTSVTEAGTPISHGSRLVGPLPVARGAQNYSLGEMDDACSVGALSMMYYCLVPAFQQMSNKALLRSILPNLARGPVSSAAFFRAHYVTAASCVFFASLSTTGVDYRQPFLRTLENAGWRQGVLDGREEASTEKLTAMGAALGLAAAYCTTKSDFWPQLKSFGGRFLPPRIVPVGLGTICMFAGGFSAVRLLFQRGRHVRQ